MSYKPTRREVLAGGIGAGISLPFLSKGLSDLRLREELMAAGGAGKTLVVLQLRGGCDGMQCLAPLGDSTFRKARGSMAIPVSKGLKLSTSSSLYWHPAMSAFRDLFNRGDLAVIQGIGYPKPNLSHFRSEDIWATGDNLTTTVSKGWLGTWRNTQYAGSFSIPMMDIESRRNDSFVGASVPVFTNRATFQFFVDTSTTAARLDANYEKALLDANVKVARGAGNPNLTFVTGAAQQTASDMKLIETVGSSYSPKVTYPSQDSSTVSLSNKMKLIASYITGGMGSKVYYADTGGFDTHANEVLATDPTGGKMAALVQRFSGVVKAFLDDLKAHGAGKDVIVMVWSEFGRRFGPNGNNGTDHGKASFSYVAGESVKGGLYGKFPDMTPYANSTNYNKISLPFTTDFRSMYATVIDKWIGGDHSKVLPAKFPLLGFLP